HSRIFYFQNDGEGEIYIGSADWMPRNLDRRIEVIVPIQKPEYRRILRDDVLSLLLTDNCQSWDLQPDGRYVRRHPVQGQHRRSAQQILLEALAK
ncbi:MAG TPA: RNA degradosome polyphosphate kinase, partial [Chthonomonadaceae bacterium]|nr:RNA degradosome polyphosphate kinase [Chthonomonadaceae bacterium]